MAGPSGKGTTRPEHYEFAGCTAHGDAVGTAVCGAVTVRPRAEWGWHWLYATGARSGPRGAY